MPSSNDAIANAIALDPEGDSHSSDTTGNDVSGTYPAFESWADDWYTLTSPTDLAVAVEIDATAAGSAFTPEVDIYKSSIAPSPPASWTDTVDLGWYVYDNASGPTARGVFLLEAGEVYYVNAYLYKDVYDPVLANNVGPYTILVEPANSPPNDNVADATVVSQGIGVTVAGTTVDATVEQEEYDAGYDNGTPTTWHKIVIEGPGVFSLSIAGVGGYEPQAIVYYAAGAVTTFDDLTDDSWSNGTPTEEDGTVTYDDSGSLWPLQGGEVFYVQIIGVNDNGPGDTGSYSLTVTSPSPAFCLDAVDYINPSSTTASVVSGAVRETQRHQHYRKDVGVPPSVGLESFLLDEDATLIIPGADILDGASMGFYAVSVKSKNNADGDFVWGGMKRNGQAFWPGSFVDSTAGTTPVTGWLTMPAGTDPTAEDVTSDNPSGYHDSQGMVWYLPVTDEDEIEIIITSEFQNNVPLLDDGSVDVTLICFQRMVDAQVGEPYDVIEMPDYPLGTTAADMDSVAQFGDIIIYKGANEGVNPSPVLTDYSLEGIDMVVTDDGTLWVAACYRGSSASGARYQGPYLLKWNGSSWDIVNDDIEGLGVKRTARHIGVSNAGGPYFLSMDTDGEDIWIGYGVDDGAGPGGFRNTVGKVRKYDVSSTTWSTVGGKIHGGVQPRIRVRNEVATFEDNMQVKISPAGVPWVAFTDWMDGPDHDDNEFNASLDFRPPFSGRFNGSSWEIRTLPPPEWYDPYFNGLGSTRDNQDLVDDYFDKHEAEDVETGSPTVGTSTFLGETTITETQTTHANHTFSFTPPAGKWCVVARVAKSSGTGTMGLKVFKNGTEQYFGPSSDTSDHIQNTVTATQFIWHQNLPFYFETDGNDTVELSYRLTAAGTLHIDKVYLEPVWAMMARITWGGWYTTFVEDGQFHVLLEFPDGEEPVAIYNTASIKAETTDPDEWGYLPENTHYDDAPDTPSPDGPLFPDISGGVFLVFPWIYSRWNSDNDEWDRLWHVSLIEREIPDSVIYKTLYHPWGFASPVGHWQQGMSMGKDEDGNVYVSANLGVIQNSNDTFWAAKLTDTGMEMPWTRSPGITGGPGYSSLYSGFTGFLPWGWDNHAHSILFNNGQLYIGYVIAGVPDAYEDTVVTFAPNGIGDWFMASERNLPVGYNDLEPLVPLLARSPSGDKIYVLSQSYIYDGATVPGGAATSGVWECDVIEDAKIPLIPILRGGIDLSRVRMRAYYEGDA